MALKETSYELFETLFNNPIFSDTKIKINNIEYHVKKDILQKSSSFFDTFFTTKVGCDENTQILDINNEEASPNLIETMFKYFYTYYGNRCIQIEEITRQNLVEQLNLFYIFHFVEFNHLKDIAMFINLSSFIQSFQTLFHNLYQIHLQTRVRYVSDLNLRFDSKEIESARVNSYLHIFCNSKDRVTPSKTYNYCHFKGITFKNDWQRDLFLHVINPAFPGNFENPVFSNAEPLEEFSLVAFKNLFGLYEEFKTLAPLINFRYRSESNDEIEKKEPLVIVQSIMEFEESLSQYLLALYSFNNFPKLKL